MRRLAAAAFLIVLVVSGHQAIGQENEGSARLTPELQSLKDRIDQRKKELVRQEIELQQLVKKYEARIFYTKKEIQELQAAEAKLLNETIARYSASARKAATNDKLDLILKKLESLEKRISNLEKKERAPGRR